MAEAVQPHEAPPGMPKPSTEHARLRPFEGTFRAEIKLWMGPGDPMVTTGTMLNSWVLDGLYLSQEYVGDKSEGPFPSFVGKGFWGFNQATGKYEGFWIDNASTIMQMETGEVDASEKIWTMRSQMTNPQTGEAMHKRSVIRLIDQSRHEMDSFFSGPDGREFKSMEIKYQRAT